jgi:hypothetical protein
MLKRAKQDKIRVLICEGILPGRILASSYEKNMFLIAEHKIYFCVLNKHPNHHKNSSKLYVTYLDIEQHSTIELTSNKKCNQLAAMSV